MGRITTHVLDTASGKPGAGIRIRLYSLNDDRILLATATTNPDGRTDQAMLGEDDFVTGRYELEFSVADYFATAADAAFLDDIVVRFNVTRDEHYHVPLLVTPWSYSIYRGS